MHMPSGNQHPGPYERGSRYNDLHSLCDIIVTRHTGIRQCHRVCEPGVTAACACGAGVAAVAANGAVPKACRMCSPSPMCSQSPSTSSILCPKERQMLPIKPKQLFKKCNITLVNNYMHLNDRLFMTPDQFLVVTVQQSHYHHISLTLATAACGSIPLPAVAIMRIIGDRI